MSAADLEAIAAAMPKSAREALDAAAKLVAARPDQAPVVLNFIYALGKMDGVLSSLTIDGARRAGHFGPG